MSKDDNENQEWLTTPEAAEYLRILVGQLRNMTRVMVMFHITNLEDPIAT